MKHIFTAASVFILLSLFSITCFAAENAKYEITWTYTVTNTLDKDIPLVPFRFGSAVFADDSNYQPDTTFKRTLNGEELDGNASVYVTLPANGIKILTDTWTFSGGAFDQSVEQNAPVEPLTVSDTEVSGQLAELSESITKDLVSNRGKAFAVYKWVTANIVYGKNQKYALPETATCETYAAVFHDILAAAGVPNRKVYGYTLRLVDKQGSLTFSKADITAQVKTVSPR